jgi:hypothetical protein
MNREEKPLDGNGYIVRIASIKKLLPIRTASEKIGGRRPMQELTAGE